MKTNLFKYAKSINEVKAIENDTDILELLVHYNSPSAKFINSFQAFDNTTGILDRTWLQIIQCRLKTYNVEVDIPLGLFIYELSVRCPTPITIALLVHAIYHIPKVGELHTFKDVMDYTDNTIPTTEAIFRFWDIQKDDLQRNKVDDNAYYNMAATA